MLRTRDSILFVFLATLLAGPGCKQGAGDRCEHQSDCSSGLRCSNNDEVGKDGICQASESIVGSNPTIDAGAKAPAPVTGPAPVVVTPVDAAVTDANGVDR